MSELCLFWGGDQRWEFSTSDMPAGALASSLASPISGRSTECMWRRHFYVYHAAGPRHVPEKLRKESACQQN